MMTTVPLRRSTKTKAPPPPVEGSAEDLAAAALSLARRFSDGATMWCVAPAWPSHARHVAVEFVHPVVVGTRALPAVSLDAATAVETVRALARPGDALLVVSTADHPVAHDLLARADAWGLTSVWLGAGPRPQTGADTPAASHVVWIDEADPAVAARSGQLVLLYHLLWELTHVVFEHPGLLVPESGNGNGNLGGREATTATALCASPARTRDAWPRCARSWRTGGSRCWPRDRRNRSTAAWSKACGRAISCWCTRAWR